MIPRFWHAAAALTILAWSVHAGDGGGSLRSAAEQPPQELAEPIRKLFDGDAIEILDAAGQRIATFWPRPSLPVDATPTQIKNGLTYREAIQTEIVAAVRFDHDWTDYRKQKAKAGVYTLRLGFQPMIGDHVGVSDHQEFLLLTSAAIDKLADPTEPKTMIDRSIKTMETDHPGVMMLFPNPRPTKTPELTKRPRQHVTLNWRVAPTIRGRATESWLGVSATILGHAE